MPRHEVRRAAVLGAGVMGSRIAAHLANRGIPVLLYDLPAEAGGDRDAAARTAIRRLAGGRPPPLVLPGAAHHITPCNYDYHLDALAGCQLVIEAVAERPDIKQSLYERVAGHLGEAAVLGSNTSGLSVAALGEPLPPEVRRRFCGIHFFNPPRQMPLVELTPHPESDPEAMDAVEAFLTTDLGKGVIRTKDTPNFIANRIGVFSMACTMHHAERLGIPPDTVDALTGPAIGRPGSATYRTADLVGLDTLRYVVEGAAGLLQDDPWVAYLKLPPWLTGLVERGALGEKSGAGVFKKTGGTIHVFDPQQEAYRKADYTVSADLKAVLREPDPAKRFQRLAAMEHPYARFLWAIHRDLFHYTAHWLGPVAHCARDLDLAVRWGFGWRHGPLEAWQAAGWRPLAERLEDAIAGGEALAAAPLPEWVAEVDGVHRRDGSFDAAHGAWRPRSTLPVYRRQYVPETVVGERSPRGTATLETGAVRLWHLEEDVGVLSFKTHARAVSREVLDGVLAAVEEAERRYGGLVVWHEGDRFSVGADLKQVAALVGAGRFDELEAMVRRFQEATWALRRARLPTVAAVHGMALGGGCEFVMHADHAVAAVESYIGLVEAGVGLIPAGGGCAELARRAAAAAPDGDVYPFIVRAFEMVAMGKVSHGAPDALEMGLLRPGDTVIAHAGELLHVAHQEARRLAEAGYRPPLPLPVAVAGRNVLATLEARVANLREGGFIAAHDAEVAKRSAAALCGGPVDGGAEVDERWLLDLEVHGFMELLHTEETQRRIARMAEGKG